MTPDELWVARREFDQLRELVNRIDSQGSRGVGVIQYQLTNLATAYADQKVEIAAVRTSLDVHEREHQAAADRAAADRRTSRHWQIGIAAALIAPLYPLLIEVLAHLH